MGKYMEKYKEIILKKCQEKGFNNVTYGYISDFFDDFYKIFDDSYLNKEKMIEKIFLNIEKDILFEKKPNNDSKEKLVVAHYNNIEKYIKLYTDTSTKEKLKQYFFHEMIHAITYSEDKNMCGVQRQSYCGDDRYISYGVALNEGITSIFERKYVKLKNDNMNEHYKPNGYMFQIDYAQAIYNILGEQMLKDYLNDPKLVLNKISEVLNYKDKESLNYSIEFMKKYCNYDESTRKAATNRILNERMTNLMASMDKLHVRSKKGLKFSMSNKEVKKENILIENAITDMLFASKLSQSEKVSLETIFDIINDCNNLKDSFVDKNTFMESVSESLLKQINNYARENGTQVEEVMNQLDINSKNKKSDISENLRMINNKIKISNILSLKNENEIILKMREELDIFDIMTDKDTKDICFKLFDKTYNEKEFEEEFFDTYKIILHSLVDSEIENFDFNNIKFTSYNLSDSENLSDFEEGFNVIEKNSSPLLKIYDDTEISNYFLFVYEGEKNIISRHYTVESDKNSYYEYIDLMGLDEQKKIEENIEEYAEEEDIKDYIAQKNDNLIKLREDDIKEKVISLPFSKAVYNDSLSLNLELNETNVILQILVDKERVKNILIQDIETGEYEIKNPDFFEKDLYINQEDYKDYEETEEINDFMDYYDEDDIEEENKKSENDITI